MRVVGVLVSKGAGFGSPDDAVYIPLTAMQQTVAQPRTAQGGSIVSSINLTVSDASQTQQVIDDITSLLRTRHKLAASADNDFRIQSMEEIASTLTQTMGAMTLLLGAIAAISLLVGGIGVMNIMLVSVLERTREIGIRKALGARERDIWSQFLIEAALLCFAGGIIGVVIGWGISTVLNKLAIYDHPGNAGYHHHGGFGIGRHRAVLRLLPRLERLPPQSYRSVKVRVEFRLAHPYWCAALPAVSGLFGCWFCIHGMVRA